MQTHIHACTIPFRSSSPPSPFLFLFHPFPFTIDLQLLSFHLHFRFHPDLVCNFISGFQFRLFFIFCFHLCSNGVSPEGRENTAAPKAPRERIWAGPNNNVLFSGFAGHFPLLFGIGSTKPSCFGAVGAKKTLPLKVRKCALFWTFRKKDCRKLPSPTEPHSRTS